MDVRDLQPISFALLGALGATLAFGLGTPSITPGELPTPTGRVAAAPAPPPSVLVPLDADAVAGQVASAVRAEIEAVVGAAIERAFAEQRLEANLETRESSPSEAPTPEERAVRERARETVASRVQTALERGRWDAEDASALRELAPQLAPDDLAEALRQMSAAVNAGRLEMDERAPL